MKESTDDDNETEQKRARIEPHLMATFHGQRVLFEERRIRKIAVATLTCDEWGVPIQLDPEDDNEPFTVSGAWSILSVWANRVGAAYVGWGITLVED